MHPCRAIAWALTLVPTVALAHPGGESHEWVHGLAHALGLADVPLPLVEIGLVACLLLVGAGIALIGRRRSRAEARRITARDA